MSSISPSVALGSSNAILSLEERVVDEFHDHLRWLFRKLAGGGKTKKPQQAT